MRAAEDGVRRFRVRDLLSLRLVVMLVWVYVLWWGEESVFNSHVQACGWEGWENWVCDAFLFTSFSTREGRGGFHDGCKFTT